MSAVRMSVFMGLTFHNQTEVVFFHLLQVDHFFAATFCPVSGAVTGEKMPGYYVAQIAMNRHGPKVGPGQTCSQFLF
jgi:hypothetical protein